MKQCKIDGCDGKAVARGWCNKHHLRWRKHGDPLKSLINTDGVTLEWMFSQSTVDITTGCIEWGKACSNNGYGKVRYKGAQPSAHRLAYFFSYGEIPSGQNVCHTCDNKKCINPDHLFLGTQAQNMMDMRKKGRSLRGEKNPCAKLCDLDVWLIRNIETSTKNKAEFFDISETNVRRIVRGESWRHVSA